MNSDPLKCIFCGTERVYPYVFPIDEEESQTYMYCDICGAHGGEHETEESAREEWLSVLAAVNLQTFWDPTDDGE